MWLVHKSPEEPSHQRKEVAAHRLEATTEQLGTTATKFRGICRDDLMFASETGLLDPEVWQFLYDIASKWWLDRKSRGRTRSSRPSTRQPQT